MDKLDEAIEDDSAFGVFWDRYARRRYALSGKTGLPAYGCRSVDSPLGGQAEVPEVA